MNSRYRLQSLDSLRGIAAISVIFCHYCYGYCLRMTSREEGIKSAQLLGLAVELFFMISGFVIYFSVDKNIAVSSFVKKRFIRLYPTFWVCLLITFSCVSLFGLPGLEVTIKEALLNITMIPQVFGAQKVDYSYWTLVPEFFFYVMIASIIFLKSMNKIFYISVFWLILSFIHIHIFQIKYFGLLLNLDYAPYFLTGIMVYELKENRKHYAYWALLFLAVALGLSKYKDSIENLVVLSLVFSLFTSFIFSDLKFLENRVLLFLGKISFPLYLLHQNIGYIIINYTKQYFGNMWVIVPPIIICILLASFVTFYVEKPIMHYLKRKLL